VESILSFSQPSLIKRLTIWDNSPESQSDIEIDRLRLSLAKIGIELFYSSNPENIVLSKVYNRFLSLEKLMSDYCLLFDDDSCIDFDFIDKLAKVLNTSTHYDLILPIVKYKGQIVSPSKRIYMKGWFYKELKSGPISSRFLSAINSGMVISSNYLRLTNFVYDERLVSYGTDDQFITEFSNNHGTAFVLDYSLEHELTLSMQNKNSLILKMRYLTMLKSWKIIFGKNAFSYFLVESYIFFHSLFISLKYKDFSYFFTAIGNSNK
tara:strand:- start:492 stop:1286 length:795 start_codon:yes stop_codon:yes gene_type:complete